MDNNQSGSERCKCLSYAEIIRKHKGIREESESLETLEKIQSPCYGLKISGKIWFRVPSLQFLGQNK